MSDEVDEPLATHSRTADLQAPMKAYQRLIRERAGVAANVHISQSGVRP